MLNLALYPTKSKLFEKPSNVYCTIYFDTVGYAFTWVNLESKCAGDTIFKISCIIYSDEIVSAYRHHR